MNKKVLFIAYHFPPDAAVGALRTQKFVKYLPEHGWQPFVLTLEDKYYPVIDPDRLRDVQAAVVERTSFWRTPLQLAIDIRDKLMRRGNSHNSLKNKSTLKSKSKNVGEMPYIKRLLAGLNWLPDDKLYWLIPGFRKGIRLIKKNNIQHIVVSAPPHSSIILAYFLALCTNSSIVIDFRDPWCLYGEGSQSNSFKPDLLIAAENRIQKKILKKTSAILATNEYFRNALLKENPFLSAEKMHVVQNGFDSSDYPAVSKKNTTFNKKYIISYLGTFYMKRNPQNFLKALSLFRQIKGLSENDIEVRFIGNVEDAEQIPVKKMIKEAGLNNVAKIKGHVKYSEALRLMRESNLLLLLAPAQPYQIPAKTYEYIAAGCPILALTEPGATASLIEDSNCGISVDPHDIQGISNALHRLYDDYQNGAKSYVCDASPFERRVQASQLAAILNNLNKDSSIPVCQDLHT